MYLIAFFIDWLVANYIVLCQQNKNKMLKITFVKVWYGCVVCVCVCACCICLTVYLHDIVRTTHTTDNTYKIKMTKKSKMSNR